MLAFRGNWAEPGPLFCALLAMQPIGYSRMSGGHKHIDPAPRRGGEVWSPTGVPYFIEYAGISLYLYMG